MQRPLSASSFRSLLHCPHSLYLDHHGDRDSRTDLSEFEQFLVDEGTRFEREWIAQREFVTPDYSDGDLVVGFEATNRLMQAGHPLIYQGVLCTGRFVGVPDLLLRREGKSEFGEWFYEPQEIKTSKSAKPFHILQVCFYAMLLEQIQNRRPHSATIVLAEGAEKSVDLPEAWPEFEKRLAEAVAITDGKTETQLAIFSGCNDCVWHDVCAVEANRQRDVSLVADLPRAAKRALTDMGICTVSDLAKAHAEALVEIRGVGEKTADRAVRQAQAQVDETIIRIGEAPLPDSPVDLFYDIEGEPNLDLDYLHGLLVIEPNKQPAYSAFLADAPTEEGQAFSRFLQAVADILERAPAAPIYHYHVYESSRVRKLFEKYPEQPIGVDALLDHFIDLHRVLKNAFVLPVEGYGLKPVSKWLGFKYRNPKSSATQSMLWYRLWMETGKWQYLDDSVLYNEDDCYATQLIKRWIQDQASPR